MKKYDGYAIVTGGARGMGAAICRQLAADGYDIVCNYVSDSSRAKVETLAAEIAEKYKRRVIPAQGNVAKYEDCRRVVDTAAAALGEQIAVLVNNAGVTVRAELVDHTMEDIERVLGTNLMAGIYMCKLVLPYMYRQNAGSIVNITSIGGMTGFVRQTTYCTTKWGMNGLTKALAKEAGPHGVRVNAVAPGFIVTDMTLENKPAFESYRAASPIGMLGDPEHIAEAVSYVVGAEFMTGQVISPNGGLVI
ncbi:SDR family NAD(P)-dependent oxidoreductase [uncultured Oscillibacter sp.]|uniref:SDR family NAD(P)-dependent oxidoreductase n=1 Tax=uncultured Oscillibacter sp. TaxID=876091 RepID=UPI00261288BF|nr:SDR family NAD(P)-dependent oxidoreductase [uncultured Oscillibacter sp.]